MTPRGLGHSSTPRTRSRRRTAALATTFAALVITLSGCTWQEGLLVARPPIYDALAFAHGPLQQLYPRRAAIIALGCDGDDPRVLERLRATLAPQHRFVELRSHLAAPLSVLEHDAMVGWLVHAALQRAPRDLFQWPGKGADGPLYKLGELRDDSDGSAQA